MDFVQAMRSEYQRSETLMWSSLSVKLVLFVLAVVGSFWTASWAQKIVITVAGIGQVAMFALRHSSNIHLRIGDRIRRLLMLQDGLGTDIPLLQTAMLQDLVGDVHPADVGSPYYSSKLPKGPQRLVEITAESAFYSGSIARRATFILGTVCIVAVSVLIFSFLVVVQAGVSQSRLEIVSRIMILGVTFWATDELVSMALRYRSLHHSCEAVLERCSGLLSRMNISADEAHAALGEYTSAIAQAPPLPRAIYRRIKDRLSKAWELETKAIAARQAQ